MSRATPSVIAHRGGALLWPENSRAAIEGAVSLGVDQVQVDVHPSADGEVVVIHDPTLERTTDGGGPVAARRWEELRRLRLRGTAGATLPLLAEAAATVAAGAARLRIELKQDAAGRPYPGLVARVLAVLDAAGMAGRTVLSAFGTTALAECAALRPTQARALLVDGATLAATPLDAILARAAALGCATLGVRWTLLDPARVAAIRAAGLRLCCFGCNDGPGLRAAFALGAEEVSTDRPDLALRLRHMWAVDPSGRTGTLRSQCT